MYKNANPSVARKVLQEKYLKRKEEARTQKEAITKLYLECHFPMAKIAKELGFSYKIIDELITEFGIKKTQAEVDKEILGKKREKNLCVNLEDHLTEINKLYIEDHKTAVEIAPIFGVNERAIRHFLLSKGIAKSKEQALADAVAYKKTRAEEISSKTKKTNTEKYGGFSPSASEEIKDKIRKTCLERYGVDCVFKSEAVKEKIKQSCKEKYGYDSYDLWGKIEDSSPQYEQEIKDFLCSLGVTCRKDRQVIAPKELDIYCPDYNIAIEFNGNYWHSSLKVPQKYHYEKSFICQQKGIRLIHIWEYEWADQRKREIIKTILKLAFGKIDQTIFARKCTVREISNAEAKDFNNLNHLQGHRNAQITYGLFYEDRLVELMSFSFDVKNNWWEIIRGCTSSDLSIIGGVSKLFTHFLRDKKPTTVFTYCDFNKFDGNSYEKLGFCFNGYTGPDMKWYLKDGGVVGRNPAKHKQLSQVAKGKLWGAGSKKYILKNQD